MKYLSSVVVSIAMLLFLAPVFADQSSAFCTITTKEQFRALQAEGKVSPPTFLQDGNLIYATITNNSDCDFSWVLEVAKIIDRNPQPFGVQTFFGATVPVISPAHSGTTNSNSTVSPLCDYQVDGIITGGTIPAGSNWWEVGGIDGKIVLSSPCPPPTTYTVTASINSGLGNITGSPGLEGNGINCPGDCSETYPSHTWISVFARPSAGYAFTGWASGNGSICAGQESACSAFINSNKTVVANFSSSGQFDYSLTSPGNVNVRKTSGDAFANKAVIKKLVSGTTQPVTLSLSGVPTCGTTPACVEYSIVPNPSSPTSSGHTSTINFTVHNNALVGTYPIRVNGSPLNKHTGFDLNITGGAGSVMSIACSADPTTALVGQVVRWSVNHSGGRPPYTYSWRGDVPSGITTKQFNIIYSTVGQKHAVATVTDADSLSASCDGGWGGGTGSDAGVVYINFNPSIEEF